MPHVSVKSKEKSFDKVSKILTDKIKDSNKNRVNCPCDKDDILYFDAYKEAQKADSKMYYRHGAILLSRDGKIIARGCNKIIWNRDFKHVERMVKSRLTFDKKFSLHAEIDALSKLNFDQKLIKGSTIVIYGQTRSGNILKSRPCHNCMKMLEFLGVRKVIYSNTLKTRVVENLR